MDHCEIVRSAGVVHRDVDPAEGGDGLVDQPIDLRPGADVGRDVDAVAVGIELSGQLMTSGVTPVDDDLRTFLEEGDRQALADARATSRDDRDAPAELHVQTSSISTGVR